MKDAQGGTPTSRLRKRKKYAEADAMPSDPETMNRAKLLYSLIAKIKHLQKDGLSFAGALTQALTLLDNEIISADTELVRWLKSNAEAIILPEGSNATLSAYNHESEI